MNWNDWAEHIHHITNIMFIFIGFTLFYVVDEVKERRYGKQQLDKAVQHAKDRWPGARHIWVAYHNRTSCGWVTTLEVITDNKIPQPRDEKGRFIKRKTFPNDGYER